MVTVVEVSPRSRASRAGILPGDILISINGNEIRDVLDYRFYLTERTVSLLVHRGAELHTFEICKGEYDDIGLSFQTPLMDKKHSCKNGCIFCFIDQLPKGLRETLYFKDDDERLSFLHGNYITLTNLKDEDIDRILKMHISPINVSVHTTNPDLRVKMMKNRRAGEVLSYLGKLAAGGITLHGQIVLCRGVNDGEELSRTLRDLAAYFPALDSVSVVPAGLTDHRDGLYPLTPFTKEECRAVIAQVEAFATAHLREKGSRLVFLADEFYLKAELPLPGEDYYEGYPQIENGVGMLTSFEAEFFDELTFRKEEGMLSPLDRRVTVVTGEAAFSMMRRLADALMAECDGLRVEVIPVKNRFFGKEITVAGLLTGKDIAEALGGKALGDEVLFPPNALRAEGDLFLCGMDVPTLAGLIGVPAKGAGRDGAEFLAALLGE